MRSEVLGSDRRVPMVCKYYDEIGVTLPTVFIEAFEKQYVYRTFVDAEEQVYVLWGSRSFKVLSKEEHLCF